MILVSRLLREIYQSNNSYWLTNNYVCRIIQFYYIQASKFHFTKLVTIIQAFSSEMVFLRVEPSHDRCLLRYVGDAFTASDISSSKQDHYPY